MPRWGLRIQIMSAIKAGPFLRYYIPAGKVMPFFEVNGLFGSSNYKYESSVAGNSYDDKYNQVIIGGGAGMAVRLGDKVIFDIMAGYNYNSRKSTQNNPNNFRTITGTIGINLGFEILLGKN
jgi:hypothetical protein